jgi:anti-sigma B factor antagonist
LNSSVAGATGNDGIVRAADAFGKRCFLLTPGKSSMFNFYYEKVGKNQDIVAVVLSGILDENSSNYLLGCVEEEILGGRKKLILDCGQVTFISSMGLGTLIRVRSRMQKIGGEVKIASVHGAVAEVMRVVGLNRIFQIYPTVDDAIAAHNA